MTVERVYVDPRGKEPAVATHMIRLMSRDMPPLWELERRLRERGYDPVRVDMAPVGWGVEFQAPPRVSLDFLIPDFIEPA